MRLAVLSDIHGNVEAPRAVFRQMKLRGADVILVAGDLAAHGPRPVETIEEPTPRSPASANGYWRTRSQAPKSSKSRSLTRAQLRELERLQNDWSLPSTAA